VDLPLSAISRGRRRKAHGQFPWAFRLITHSDVNLLAQCGHARQLASISKLSQAEGEGSCRAEVLG